MVYLPVEQRPSEVQISAGFNSCSSSVSTAGPYVFTNSSHSLAMVDGMRLHTLSRAAMISVWWHT